MCVIKIPVVLLAFIVAGCSSKLTIKSEPAQADIFVLEPGTQDKKLVGKTPLEMPPEDLFKNLTSKPAAGEFVTLFAELPGYETFKMSIPANKFSTLGSVIDIKLKEGATAKELKTAKEIVDQLFLAQKFALLGQFERAHIELDKIVVSFPNFARAITMRASVYYAQKNLPESLKWYEEALKIDPSLDDAIKMASKIRTQQGGRLPANEVKKK